MKKIMKLLVAMSMVCVLAACSSEDEVTGSDTLSRTYTIYVEGDDWGCGVSQAIVTLDYVVDEVSAEDFTVTETKQTTDWTDEGSPFLYSMTTSRNTWSDPYYLTITLSDSAALTSAGTEVTSFTVDTEYTAKTTSADGYSTDTYEASDGTTYNYAYYNAEDSDTLFVWLHGGGEGEIEGSDVYVPLLANEVTAYIGDKFQDTLGGVSVLAPQCPTYWMDTEAGEWDFDSYYTESLTELISTYAESIDATKIVLAGCSNGGYMTMVLAINNPDAYTAIVPICEGLADEFITDDMIESLVDLPMYFVYSEADTTLDPTVYSIPTIERLQEAGTTNLHVSTTEHVVDLSGRFDDEDGNAYQYTGHWSWIYFDNNETECDDCGMNAWDWIAQQIQ